MTEVENKLLARGLLAEVVNTGAADRLPEFLAFDCAMPGIEAKGLTWFREHLRAWHECYPGFVVTVDGQVAEDEIVVTWWTMRGTHSGVWNGLAPTHKPVLIRGVNIQKVRDGRIVEHSGGSNSLDVLLELGLVKWTIGQKETAPEGSPGSS
jgi:predicted ester cyclase